MSFVISFVQESIKIQNQIGAQNKNLTQLNLWKVELYFQSYPITTQARVWVMIEVESEESKAKLHTRWQHA